jgi:hypothetical protein
VGNSYLYHTRSDVTSALQPGMLQHFGESESLNDICLFFLLHILAHYLPSPLL